MSRLAQYKKIQNWKNLFNFKSEKTFKERLKKLFKKKENKKSLWEKTKLFFNPEITQEPKELKEKLLGLKPFRDVKEMFEAHQKESKLLIEFEEIKKKLESFHYGELPECVQERAKEFYHLAYEITKRKSNNYDKSVKALDLLLESRDLYLSSHIKKN